VDILRSEPWAGRSHDPLLLSVHLEGQEPVYFIAGQEEAAAQRAANVDFRSKWTAYMKLCRDEAVEENMKAAEIDGYEPHWNACRYKFAQIEEHFTFHKKDPLTGEYIWRFEERKRDHRGGLHIGMIYPVNPTNRELFATYLLALELRGVQSYEDLCSLNRPLDDNFDPSRPASVPCANAIAACVSRGLLSTDARWVTVMDEVCCTIHNSRALVDFFTRLLLFSKPNDPRSLFDK
jgi:hypothetical protein